MSKSLQLLETVSGDVETGTRYGGLKLLNNQSFAFLDVLQHLVPAVVINGPSEEVFGSASIESHNTPHLKVDDEFVQIHQALFEVDLEVRLYALGQQERLHHDVVAHLGGDVCEAVLVGSLYSG